MMFKGDSSLLSRWTALRENADSQDDVIGLPTSRLESKTEFGFLRLALGNAGEPRLMIPVDPRTDVPQGLEGESLHISISTYTIGGGNVCFLDITCVDSDLEQGFSWLVSDIVSRIDSGARSENALKESIGEFRDLLKKLRQRITREKAAGLLGELLVLQNIVGAEGRGWRSWQGPDGSRHDFRYVNSAIEVKSSLRRQTPIVEISAIDQLEIPEGGKLYLCHYMFELTSSGNLTVPSLAEDIFERAGRPDELEEKFNNTGYSFDNPDPWSSWSFSILNRQYYRIDDDFPKLTIDKLKGNTLPAGVSGVRYTLDLSQATRFVITTEEISNLMEEFRQCH